MGFEITGRLHVISEAQQKSERFRLRQFVVELGDNPQYPQHVQFQLTGDRCENLDGFNVGDEVKLEFSLRGREWTSPQGDVKFFNSLDVWRIDRIGDPAAANDGGGFGDSAGFGGGGGGGTFGDGPKDDIPAPSDDDIPF
ncbi:MAG: DUF3127 domain-containing protein [Myxococcota bacterium]|nr:DUF3127 domain-containing protein [Myxococcota bacterium]